MISKAEDADPEGMAPEDPDPEGPVQEDPDQEVPVRKVPASEDPDQRCFRRRPNRIQLRSNTSQRCNAGL